MAGINIKLFETAVDKIFICDYCSKVAVLPKMCPQCQNFHCSSEVSKCQSCSFELTEPSEVLMRFYKALTYQCQACKAKVTMGEFSAHQEDCKKVDELTALRKKVSELIAENDMLRKENESLKKQKPSKSSQKYIKKDLPKPPPGKAPLHPKEPLEEPKKSPYEKELAASIIQRAFRQRDKGKVKDILAKKRAENMHKTFKRKQREEVKDVAKNINNVVKNLPSNQEKHHAKRAAVEKALKNKRK